MTQYCNPRLEEAQRLNTRASATFDEGTEARETADRYVRVTVLFALVLFLVAVGQRFRVRRGAARRDGGGGRVAGVRPVHRVHPAAAVGRTARSSQAGRCR
jgi:hypothetical protein